MQSKNKQGLLGGAKQHMNNFLEKRKINIFEDPVVLNKFSFNELLFFDTVLQNLFVLDYKNYVFLEALIYAVAYSKLNLIIYLIATYKPPILIEPSFLILEKNPYNYDGIYKDFMNIQSPIPPVFYLEPKRENKTYVSNIIGAADFETVTLPSSFKDPLFEELRNQTTQPSEIDFLEKEKEEIKALEKDSKLEGMAGLMAAELLKEKKEQMILIEGPLVKMVSEIESGFENEGKVDLGNAEVLNFQEKLLIDTLDAEKTKKNVSEQIVVSAAYKIGNNPIKVLTIDPLVFQKLSNSGNFSTGDLEQLNHHSNLLLERFVLSIVNDCLNMLRSLSVFSSTPLSNSQSEFERESENEGEGESEWEGEWEDEGESEGENENENQSPFLSESSILDPKSKKKIVIYFHNFARFDGYFLLKILLSSAKLRKALNLDDCFDVLFICGQVLQIRIGSIVFLDSYKLVSLGLNALGKTLLGRGKKEFNVKDISSLQKMREVFCDPEKLEELKAYNLDDVDLLYECVSTIQSNFGEELKYDISNSITTPGIGMDLFLKRYYKFTPQTFLLLRRREKKTYFQYQIKNKNKVNLKNINKAIFVMKPFLENEIRSAFYGGRTELFSPAVVNGIYVDMNGLYTFAALAPLPFGSPITKAKVTGSININTLKSFMGFLKIEWVSPPDLTLLPVLPRKHPNKYNVYALGTGEGYYYAKEVLLAIKKGYKIKVLAYIKYHPKAGLKKMMKDLAKIREKFPKQHPVNIMAKLIANSISFGKWAIKLNSIKARFFYNIENEKVKKRINKFKKNNDVISIKSWVYGDFKGIIIYFREKPLDDNNMRALAQIRSDSMLPNNNLNANVSKGFNMASYKKAKSCPHIAAAVTSQARLAMYPFLSHLFEKGCLVYTDTDSIVLTREGSTETLLTKRMDQKKNGFFKKEADVLEGEFAAPKIYAIKSAKSAEDFLKFKGMPKQELLKILNQSNVKTTEEQDISIVEEYAKAIYQDLIYENIDVKLEDVESDTKKLIKLLKEARLKGKNFSLTYEQAESMVRDYKKISVQIRKNKTTVFTNESLDKYRRRLYDAKGVWVGTETLILNKDFQIITLNELEIIYEKFETNIIFSPAWPDQKS